MPEVRIEIDDEAFAEFEAAAAERGIAVSDIAYELLLRGMTMRRNAEWQRDDPLGYDTSDEDAAIRQMTADALSGRNEDAVKAEVAAVSRKFGPFG